TRPGLLVESLSFMSASVNVGVGQGKCLAADRRSARLGEPRLNVSCGENVPIKFPPRLTDDVGNLVEGITIFVGSRLGLEVHPFYTCSEFRWRGEVAEAGKPGKPWREVRKN